MKKLCTILACLLFFGVASAQAAEKVRLIYVEWPCATITHYIAKEVIETRLNQQVEMLPVSVPLMFQALANKQADASLSVWLPLTHESYMEKLGSKLVDLGPIVGGCRLAWVVPDYVPITTMEGLRGQADKFKGRVYGIEPGANYGLQSERAIKEYGLDGFELIESSDALMVATLADAIRRNEWVVVTGWAPHWKFARWPLHFLEDSKKLFGGEEGIHVITRLGLAESNPKLNAFLDNFFFTDTQQLQILMDAIQHDAPEVVAKRFVQENPDQVNEWLK